MWGQFWGGSNLHTNMGEAVFGMSENSFPYLYGRFGVMLGEVERAINQLSSRELEEIIASRGSRGSPGRSEPGNRAHTFQMTLVSRANSFKL